MAILFVISVDITMDIYVKSISDNCTTFELNFPVYPDEGFTNEETFNN